MKSLWHKLRKAITLDRVINIVLMLTIAAVSFAVGYAAPKKTTRPVSQTIITAGETTTDSNTSDDTTKSSMEQTTSTTTIQSPSSTQGITTTTTTTSSQNITTGKISINSATKEQLMSVPGIGEKFAQKIIDYRTINNGFIDLSELKNIDGIGDARYRKWKDYFIID